MDEIRWEDPPHPRRPPAGIWIERLRPLMDHPKRWAVVATRSKETTARVIAHDLRRGKFHMPSGRWEFTASAVDGEYRVYARYLGPDEDGTP